MRLDRPNPGGLWGPQWGLERFCWVRRESPEHFEQSRDMISLGCERILVGTVKRTDWDGGAWAGGSVRRPCSSWGEQWWGLAPGWWQRRGWGRECWLLPQGFHPISLQDSAGSSGRLRLPGSPNPRASRTLGPTPVGALVVFRKQGAEVLRVPRRCRATMDPEAEVVAPVVGGKGWGISLHPRETPDHP